MLHLHIVRNRHASAGALDDLHYLLACSLDSWSGRRGGRRATWRAASATPSCASIRFDLGSDGRLIFFNATGTASHCPA